jgi:glycosyltransferase XagB
MPNPDFWLSLASIIITSALSFQGIFTLMWMLYAWENPLDCSRHKSSAQFTPPKLSFTALLPARHEEKVIADTIRALAAIDYPRHLKEVLVLCHTDDRSTIRKVNQTITELGDPHIRLVTFSDFPVNKPHSLNIGLKQAANQIVTVFDAEDQIHPDLYRIINTAMASGKTDVIQSGVQLMNYTSRWFSALNVLEYFFWFKSGLPFFSRFGPVTPLGGNTVFIKKSFLDRVNGWDEHCLTEDADIAVRLLARGAKFKVIYDEVHVTREETPHNVAAFIRQRTRWDQGFLQVLLKGNWQELPQTRQKLISVYTLIAPFLQLFFLLYLPFGLWIGFHHHLPVLISLFSFLPAYIFLIQIGVYFVGIREFAKSFHLPVSLWDSFKVIFVFVPYQLLLVIASVRAVYRLVYKQNSWEKTYHCNAHRVLSEPVFPAYTYAQTS